jgi:hypothetical protein
MQSRVVALVCLLVLVAGCSEGRAARQGFGTTYSCPDDQITVEARHDLSAHDPLGKKKAAVPPPEVKRDPARYAVWQENQATANDFSNYDAQNDVLDITGCGHHALYVCSPWTRGKHFYAWCSEAW